MPNRLTTRDWDNTPEDRPRGPALVICCPDGCLAPNALEGQLRPGAVRTLRTPANVVPPFGAGLPDLERAIERAIAEGGAREIVICGHDGCPALASAFDPQGSLPDLAQLMWLEHVEAVTRRAAALPPEQRLTRAVEWNVAQQLLHLQTHPFVAGALGAGRLRLLGWVYDPATDTVGIPDPRVGRRRAALDPGHNFLFRPERLREHSRQLPGGDLRTVYLA